MSEGNGVSMVLKGYFAFAGFAKVWIILHIAAGDFVSKGIAIDVLFECDLVIHPKRNQAFLLANFSTIPLSMRFGC